MLIKNEGPLTVINKIIVKFVHIRSGRNKEQLLQRVQSKLIDFFFNSQNRKIQLYNELSVL